MAYRDLVKQAATVNGTGPFTLGAAVSSQWQTMNANRAIGELIDYAFRKGNEFETGVGTLTDASTLTRTTVGASSNGGAKVNFSAGTGEIIETVTAASLNDFAKLSQGVTLASLQTAGSIPDTALLEICDPANGMSFKATVAALRAVFGGTAPQGDTAGPTMNGALTSSNVTQTAATLAWPAASDNVAVTGYETSKDGGTTWTNVGDVLTYTYSNLTAGTTYAMRVRGVDAAGNKSLTPLSLSVTTAASSDSTNPSMAGSLTTTNVTDSGYTMNWPAGSDNVAVTGYESSIDGGVTWTNHPSNVLTRAVTNRPASTTDNLRVRCYDAAGLRSNVLSATVTTSVAAPQTAYTITSYTGSAPSAAMKSTIDASGGPVYGTKRQIIPSAQVATGNGIYWLVSPDPTAAGGMQCGWSESPTVPPGTTGSNADVGNSVNRFTAMNWTGSAWQATNNLWATNGAGASEPKKYFWIWPAGGAAQCITPAGVTITGA